MERIRHEEGTFAGMGSLALYHQAWLPPAEPRAVLLVAHGYAEHSSRYAHVAEYFVARRYAVYALDHRGHGKSEGERVHVDAFGDYATDLKTYFDLVRERQPSAPAVLVGHSMGAFIAIEYAARHQDELAALVLSGGGLGDGRPRPASQTPVDLSATVSHDPGVVEAYRNDPLIYHGAPPDSRRGVWEALRAELPALARAVTLPVIIMAGGASPLGEGEGAPRLYETVSSQDRTLMLYDGLMHEIFNEPEREQVFGDLAAWLDARLPR